MICNPKDATNDRLVYIKLNIIFIMETNCGINLIFASIGATGFQTF